MAKDDNITIDVSHEDLTPKNDKHSENVNLGEDDKRAKRKNASVKIDFEDESAVKEAIATPTKESNKENRASFTQDDIINSEKKIIEDGAPLSSTEAYQMADFAIDMYDILLSSILRVVAMDTTSDPYSMTKERRKGLADKLAVILVRYQKKFPLGFLFIIGLVGAAVVPVVNCKNNRKINQAKRAELVKKIKEEKVEKRPKAGDTIIKAEQKVDTSTSPEHDKSKEEFIKDLSNGTTETATVISASVPKRKPGRVPKGG